MVFFPTREGYLEFGFSVFSGFKFPEVEGKFAFSWDKFLGVEEIDPRNIGVLLNLDFICFPLSLIKLFLEEVEGVKVRENFRSGSSKGVEVLFP